MEKNLNKAQQLILLTEDVKSNLNENIGEYHYLSSHQVYNNEQKLLDFISDKQKLNLKSCFDHKGCEDFLTKKNEAMEKIELNEQIDENSINQQDKGKKKLEKIKKKISKKKPHLVEKNKHLLKMSEEKFHLENKEEIQSKSKEKNHKSSKFINNYNYNEKLEEDSTGINVAPKILKESKFIKDTNKNKKIKEKMKKHIEEKNPKNNNISIESISTVNSKLFNNQKDFERYKKLYINEDDAFIEEIVKELKSNM